MSFIDLFRDQLDSGSFDDRLKAIEKLTDQKKLHEIVIRNHEDLQLRAVALKNISCATLPRDLALGACARESGYCFCSSAHRFALQLPSDNTSR